MGRLAWRSALAALAALPGCLSEPAFSGEPPSTWSAVSGGALHTCGIRSDGTLWCWGRNDFGQLGTSSNDVEDDVPTQVGSASTWSAVSAGGLHTCALDTGKNLWCWGENAIGQLGIGSGSGVPIVYEPAPLLESWNSVSAGAFHTCAIKTDASLWCWGDDSGGEVGNGTFAAGSSVFEPVEINGSNASGGWLEVAAGDEVTCALALDHTVWCWGYNGFGTVGTGSSTVDPIAVPTPVVDGSDADTWQHVAMGGYTACGIAGSNLRCWGANTAGQVGNDSTNPVATPTAVGHDEATWLAIAVGFEHACGIQTDGALYCWGANLTDQLATPTAEPFLSSPAEVTSTVEAWTAVAAGAAHTCGIDANHRLWCAGQNGGQLGAAGGGSRTRPELIGGAAVVAIGGDVIGRTGGTVCALGSGAGSGSGSELVCWGDNAYGQVGDETQFDRDVPTLVTGAWLTVAVADHACALDTNHHMWCWGNNTNDAVEAGAAPAQLVPVQVGSAQWSSVTVGPHSCAIDEASHAWCWGLNGSGQTAQNPGSGHGIIGAPALVESGSAELQWAELVAGDDYTCGVDSSGLLECWGDGQYGNGPTQQFTPAVVDGFEGVQELAAGGDETCVGGGSTSACFGDDDHGQVGNETTSPSAMFQLPDGWLQVSVGENHACGVTLDHTLACWGANAYGELGVGSFVEYHEPQMVGSGSNWAYVVAGVDNTCALTTGSDLYCWGRNLEGEVGDGSAWRSTLQLVQ